MKNVYTIYGDEASAMSFPPAYQAAAPFGATTGGGHPDTRIMDDGEPKIRRGRDEIFISKDVAYREGAFYEYG